MIQRPVLVALTLCLLFANTALTQQKKGNAKAEPAITLNPWGRPPKVSGEHVLNIWQDDSGWHVRAYADGKRVAKFTGTIRVVNGTVSKIWGTEGLEPGNQADDDLGEVSKDKKTITLQFKVFSGEDGFDFAVTRTATKLDVMALFEKYEHPEMIRIGREGQIAPSSKVSLPIKPASASVSQATGAEPPTQTEIEKLIVGKWFSESGEGGFTSKVAATYRKDGTLSIEATITKDTDFAARVTSTGTWKVTDSKIVQTVEKSDPPGATGKESTSDVIAIDEKAVRFRDSKGRELTATRMAE